MMTQRSLGSVALAVALATFALPATPVLADGAASTRNILGGAALVGGALLIINHNKQVHAREAQAAQEQAATAEAANNAQAAYASEHQAYLHEAALVGAYKKETAFQHSEIVRLRNQVAETNSAGRAQATVAGPASQPVRVAATSYGWGTL